MQQLYGGVEAGGTKFVCMVASGPDNVVSEMRFPTTHPDETLQQTIEFFAQYAERGELAAIGIGSFGPLDLNPDSPTFGYITTTPKPFWGQVDLRGRIQRALQLPVVFETDVTAAAFGEQYWNPHNRQLDPFVYMTVGTGIGVGILANGHPLHGLVHTEAGHMAIRHDWQKDPFPGICPFHGDCLEGLASGPSMHRRWGQTAESLPDDHPAWDLEADYIALALLNIVYVCSPQRIVLGGGVSQHAGLHGVVRRKIQQFMHGYLHAPMLEERIGEYLVPPALDSRSGALGAVAMAIEMLKPQ